MGLELSSHKNSGQGRVVSGQKLQPLRTLRFTKEYKNKLWPDYRGDRILLGGCGAGVARGGIGAPEFVVELDAFEGAVDHGFELAGIFYFAAFGEAALGFFRAHPRGAAIAFIGAAHLVDFHQEGFDHEFLHAAGLPEHALRMNVEMEMARLDGADGSGFFGGFAFGGLAVREARVSRALGESPLVAPVGIYQEELNGRAAPAITDRSHLKRQRLRDAG